MAIVNTPVRSRYPTAVLLKLAGSTLLITAAAAAITLALVPGSVPWPAVALNIGIFFVYALIIGGLCWAVMPALGVCWEPRPWAIRWTLLLAAMLGLSIAGTALASLATHYMFPAIRQVPVSALFREGLPAAIPITIIVGVITTVIEAGKGRLAASQAALQEQRLERERAEKLAAEAQLASLTSRVQPHFLFNTLNSIAALIRDDPKQAEQTIERLASLLRSSLDTTQVVPLEQEIRLVRDYLEIQKTRLAPRLTFKIGIEPGLRANVPPFSVQTLVENSLKHVAGQRPQGVSLQVRASRIDENVVVSVSDDGPGFDAQSLRSGSGLDNLQGRLRAIYGDRAGLEFVREPGRMTVRLRVPADLDTSG